VSAAGAPPIPPQVPRGHGDPPHVPGRAPAIRWSAPAGGHRGWFPPPGAGAPGLRSLARIRSGGMRLMRGRKSRIWLVLAIAGPGRGRGQRG
jgi:hypothetical protein